MHFPTIAFLAITSLTGVLASPAPNAAPAPTPINNVPGYPAYARAFYLKRQDDGTGEDGGDASGGDASGGDGSGDDGSDAGDVGMSINATSQLNHPFAACTSNRRDLS